MSAGRCRRWPPTSATPRPRSSPPATTATTTSATSAREAEVPFCGHATIATGVALAERDGAGPLVFHARRAAFPVHTRGERGAITATLTSVVPHVEEVPDACSTAASTRWAGRGRTGPGAAAADRLRGRAPPDPGRRHARAPRRARLRLRRAQAGDVRTRADDRRPRLPRGRADLQRAQPVPGRRRSRGPGDRRGGRRVRGLPARTGAGDAAGDGDRPPGRRHGPAEPADDRDRRRRPEIRVTGRAVAM